MTPGRGAFVVVIGPDGVGKTTLARRLIAQSGSPTMYVHFRPPIFSRPPFAPIEDPSPPPPKRVDPGPRLLGWIRLGWSILVFNIGYWLWLRPALRRGALVVGDRWVYGYVGQPTALGFRGPAWLARRAVRLAPRPTLLVRLKTQGAIAAGRKGDLTPGEVAAEDDLWDSLQERALVLDAARPADEIAAEVIDELARAIEQRQATARR